MRRLWTKGRVLAAAWAVLAASAGAEVVVVRLGEAPKAGPAAKAEVPRGKAPTTYVPKARAAPELDGKLDEPLWKDAAVLHVARTLDGSGRAAQPTEVRLLLHGTTLYVGVRATEPLIDKLQATRRGRDGPVWDDDSIEIFLGTGGEYYHLGVNALASTYDGKAKNASWNGDLKAAAGRGASEYRLEIAIDLAKMAGTTKLPTDWIANFNRNRRVTGSLQESSWSPTYSDDSHVPSRFGKMLLKPPPKEEPGEGPPRPVVKTQAVEVLPAADGLGVVRFDLSKIPRGARVYRADLLIFRTTEVDGRMDQAVVNVEVYPLFAAFRGGGKPQVSGEPLAIRPPWFDRLDATQAVRQWLSGKGTPGRGTLRPGDPKVNGGFFVKSCPFWNAEATCLDVWYEGRPSEPPKQVSGIQALHRAGQTFVTWREIDDRVGTDTPTWGKIKSLLDSLDQVRRVRYCVFRHGRQITPGNLHEAELIATVKPLSGWNVNGRSLGRAIDLYIATADQLMTGQWSPFWQARMDGKYGVDCPIDRLAVQDGKPLPRGTGLYVHSPGQAGKAWYAVCTSLDGAINTKDISAANSLAQPVAETEGVGEPVLQKELPKMPFFNFHQKRLHYVRWVAPPLANAPSAYHNWSVGVPEPLGRSVPLELNFHRDGYSYWRTHYRIERDSIVLCPHDFPVQTFWYGCHESLGTLKSFRQGRIRPYTERRLIEFVDWACRTWPVDRNRILVTGCRGGGSGSGALHLALRHPKVFNLVIAGHPILDYAADAKRTDRGGLPIAQAMQRVWGRPDWNLLGEDGQPFWPRHNMVDLVKATSPEVDLPYVTMTSSGQSGHPFYEAMLSQRRGLLANFAWGGARYIPVANTGTYPNVIRQDIRKDGCYLAFGSPEEVANRKNSQLNREYGWRVTLERPDRFETELLLRGAGGGTTDVTLRRCRTFRIAKGRTYAWNNVTKDRRGDPVKQNGEVTVRHDGVLTVLGVQIGGKLVIEAK